MTVATMQVEVTKLRLEIAALRVDIMTMAARLPPPEKPLYESNWLKLPSDNGWGVQEFAPGRATLVPTREGRLGVRLHTEPGDTLFGTGLDRCDLHGGGILTFKEGDRMSLAHSVLFPDDFVDQPPSVKGGTWNWGVVMDFHDDADIAGSQGPVQLMMQPRTQPDPNWPTGLNLEIYGGAQNAGKRNYPLGPITRNSWYDFVYDAYWTSKPDGFFTAWLNGKLMFQDKGPNLYTGRGVYFKLANYHQTHGKPSSIIHDRVVQQAV